MIPIGLRKRGHAKTLQVSANMPFGNGGMTMEWNLSRGMDRIISVIQPTQLSGSYQKRKELK
jgi:hypothetical protein